MIKKLVFAAGAMLALGVLTTDANAQDTRRGAVMEECVARAQAQLPSTGNPSDPGNNHTWEIYAGCMQNLGELDLYFQIESPGKDKEANWLPAPKGAFNLNMRRIRSELQSA
jgi:hypothetical protein